MPVAADTGRAAAEAAQRLDRARGLQFGQEADQRVDCKNRCDCAAFFQFPEIEGERGRGGQQIDHRALELMRQHDECAGPAPGHDGVRPIGLSAALDLLDTEADGGRDVQQCECLDRRQRVGRVR